ncbi:LLM class flavin-dependent oxidoreductase [Jiangella asiatica]|uniref:LLM class flavin-dependent oxidoreductase n=1 Tax=Jiangella asiatica TaxID=2530372 RepID=A0A4V6PF84_9ACTN|nr:LLM class flavin-dependent oxidoreductase [Jiangella asiatica]TDD95407.1 LLM class flavin-dependent oxidoreductase [Jiangella asiatica]
MRAALFMPIFDDLADPRVLVQLAVEAEDAGWDGVFLWDHVRLSGPVRAAADPWIALAAIAAATSRILIGPMVTPLARRRPVKVARETASLDVLSGGRLTLGVGTGSDEFGHEYSITGEDVDDRTRAEKLDESLEILEAAWSGDEVRHRGRYFTVDGMRFLPRPAQRPGVPVWVGGYRGKVKPLRRAARYQGYFPIGVDSPDHIAEAAAQLTELRRQAGVGDARFDLVASLPADEDPAAYAAAGATWRFTRFPASVTVDQVRGVLRVGP